MTTYPFPFLFVAGKEPKRRGYMATAPRHSPTAPSFWYNLSSCFHRRFREFSRIKKVSTIFFSPLVFGFQLHRATATDCQSVSVHLATEVAVPNTFILLCTYSFQLAWLFERIVSYVFIDFFSTHVWAPALNIYSCESLCSKDCVVSIIIFSFLFYEDTTDNCKTFEKNIVMEWL